jgi:uncharacterized protein (DUF924 family)
MHKEVHQFWFEEATPQQWFVKDESFDNLISQRFSEIHNKAIQCELFKWRQTSQGRLAEIIVIDQFSRNMFRDSPCAFAYDSLALALAQEAISVGIEKDLSQPERTFLYMPFMHSESLAIHDQAVELFKSNGLESNLDYEYKHKIIIERFGRYPHRNQVLGRESTPEELDFLSQHGSRF